MPPRKTKIPQGKAELGLGIHGEAGVQQVEYRDARGAVAMVVEKLSPLMRPGVKHTVLLNNLGGATVLEMSVLMYELSRSSIADRIGTVVGPAAMMTSLDMRGFSVSVYAAPDEHLKALAEPVDTAAWPGIHTLARGEVRALPDGLKPIKPLPSPHPATRRFVAQCCEILIAAEASLNALELEGRRRGHGIDARRRGAGPDRGDGRSAACRSHAAPARDRAGTIPDHGRIVGCPPRNLLRRGR